MNVHARRGHHFRGPHTYSHTNSAKDVANEPCYELKSTYQYLSRYLTRIFAKSNHLVTFVDPCTVIESKNSSCNFADGG